MNSKDAFELIDSYALNDCASLLMVYAPDLYEDLRSLVRNGSDAQTVLDAARSMVKQAYLRENN